VGPGVAAPCPLPHTPSPNPLMGKIKAGWPKVRLNPPFFLQKNVKCIEKIQVAQASSPVQCSDDYVSY
jgi:hypothetical protein